MPPGVAGVGRRLLAFGPLPDTLDFILGDLNTGPLLDLAHGDSQVRLMQSWGIPELVVLDNLASLAGLKGGDPDRWHELQRFLMRQRRNGRAMLLVHHANKKGLQRGSSRREDVVDLVMAMRRPDDWKPADGTRFEIHFEKARALHGRAIEPIVARLEEAGEGLRWQWGPAAVTLFERAVALFGQGFTITQVAESMSLSRSGAHRLRQRAQAKGRLDPSPPGASE